MAEVIDIVPYDAKRHRRGIREVLAKNGWEEHYIAGQLAGLDLLSGDPLPGMRGKVFASPKWRTAWAGSSLSSIESGTALGNCKD